jgi:hypothetical protein
MPVNDLLWSPHLWNELRNGFTNARPTAIFRCSVAFQGEIPEVWEVWWPTFALTSALLLVVTVHSLNFPPSAELYALLIVSAAWLLGLRALRQHFALFVLRKGGASAGEPALPARALPPPLVGNPAKAAAAPAKAAVAAAVALPVALERHQSFSMMKTASLRGQRSLRANSSSFRDNGTAERGRGALTMGSLSRGKGIQDSGGKLVSLLGDEADKALRRAARLYAITYDCLFRREFLRNHFLLTVCLVLGYFVNTQFFTLMLLDVVNLVPLLSDLIQSILAQGKQLALIFYLFCTTVVIFASFGMNNFKDDLRMPSEDPSEEKVCGSMLSCFYFILYSAARGNMKDALLIPEPGSQHYVMRIVFDTVFFVWVGLVLMNIITGLMVEFFSSARLNKRRRAEQMDTEVIQPVSLKTCFLVTSSNDTVRVPFF